MKEQTQEASAGSVMMDADLGQPEWAFLSDCSHWNDSLIRRPSAPE
jgi:hypothetical protein